MEPGHSAHIISYIWPEGTLAGHCMPFAYDDPENAELVKQFLINAFGGAGMGTEHRQFHARCTPLITANEHVMEQLSLAGARYINSCM